MTITKSDVITIMEALIPETVSQQVISSGEKDIAVDAALVWHSRIYPQRKVYVGSADGSSCIYDLPSDVQSILQVEVPQGQAPPSFLPASEWTLLQGTAGLQLVFDNDPGEQFAVHYRGEWELDDLEDKDAHRLAYLAAAWVALRRAAVSAESVSSLISADTTNFNSQTRSWLAILKELITFYAISTGVSADQILRGAPDPAMGLGSVPQHFQFKRVFWG